jgi:hypothetical protein
MNSAFHKGESAMNILFALLLAVTLSAVGGAQTNSDKDEAAIKITALNYIEGYYEGDGVRMESAVHPELAKRMVQTDSQTGQSRLNQMSAMTLVQGTKAGYGRSVPKEQQQKDVTVLDRYNNVAMVKIIAANWIDYLQMAKYNGEWKIINVLWESKPKSE